jgi:hypothetical protein
MRIRLEPLWFVAIRRVTGPPLPSRRFAMPYVHGHRRRVGFLGLRTTHVRGHYRAPSGLWLGIVVIGIVLILLIWALT